MITFRALVLAPEYSEDVEFCPSDSKIFLLQGLQVEKVERMTALQGGAGKCSLLRHGAQKGLFVSTRG